ncbi:hypothetical protein DYI20_10610 [Auritidibacter ignavus]|nr:hypothetical protein DCC27_009245 [Auritidibacter sp. NML130574]PXA76787.1 hypothetical protein DCC26_08985 [Auritidibacter sp. NML120779]PXA79317.1 hypothetical protein DCC25_09240 [Auritidibacter sp. NML120636]RMX22323.1 hypothetical protein DYI20_10610 [Auritidibacter ignavus]
MVIYMTSVPVIFDIVGSRDLPDRVVAHSVIMDAFARIEEQIVPDHPAWATVGDEFQAVYFSWQDAVRSLYRVHLFLPAEVQVRAGVGMGRITTIARSVTGPIHDGPGWIAAREALNEAEVLQQSLPAVRHRLRGEDADLAAAVNAQFLAVDQVLARFKSRERRMAGALLHGVTQREIAQSEGISQAAVSKAVHRSGAAMLLRLDRELAGETS